MKRLLKLFALAVMLVGVTANGFAQTTNYDNGFKYGLLSNLEVGVCGIYSYEITNQAHHKNAGAQLIVTKRIGDYWRIRGVAEVNGFIPNKFDRFGKGMVGFSFDLLPFYVYADYGANLNPSSKSKFGLAMDGGIGLQFKVGNTASLYVEGGVDRTNNGNKWQSNAEVKAGVLVNTGITEQDRVNKSITDNMRSEYGELKGENKLLKSALEKAQKTNEEQNTTLSESIALLNEMREQLNSCKQERKEIEENCKKGLQVIYFDFGSAMISDVMDDLIADAADIILNDNNDYRIEGYCSANGSDYTNQILSERRANAVYQRLVLYGVPEYRLYTQGNGMTEIDRASEQRVIIVKIEK